MDIPPVSNIARPSPASTVANAPPPAPAPAAVATDQPATLAEKEHIQAQLAAQAIPSRSQLDAAVKSINEAMESLSQQIEFTVDKDTDRTVVKVIDQRTKEVIRQMPTEETLAISKALDRMQGLLIKQKA